MRNLMLLSLFALSLALNCAASAPISMSGDSGKAILMQVASVNVTNETTKASQGDIWNFGKTPMNYVVDSGKPLEQASYDDYDIWLGAINSYMPLNTSEYT
jgi:hypothetical protein